MFVCVFVCRCALFGLFVLFVLCLFVACVSFVVVVCSLCLFGCCVCFVWFVCLCVRLRVCVRAYLLV